MHRETGIYAVKTISPTSPVASPCGTAESTWALLVRVTHVHVGHSHPPSGSTSGGARVTVLKSGIACVGALYPVLTPCTAFWKVLTGGSRVVEGAFRRKCTLQLSNEVV